MTGVGVPVEWYEIIDRGAALDYPEVLRDHYSVTICEEARHAAWMKYMRDDFWDWRCKRDARV